MRKYCWVLFLILLGSCITSKKGMIKKQLAFSENLFQNHVGFSLYDLETKTYLFKKNDDRYFLPASNTKIFTFYAGLILLKDQTPAIQYEERSDSLIFWGTGDPSFLSPSFSKHQPVFDFLKNSKKSLFLATNNFKDTRFGRGWMWDDYHYSFSSEKSPFPIYNNTIAVKKEVGNKHLQINAPYFKRYFQLNDQITHSSTILREETSNKITHAPFKERDYFYKKWPFKYSDSLVANLLADTLDRKVRLIKTIPTRHMKTLYSVPTDSLYKKMMQESDNFIAEQLMLVYSSQLGDSLNTQAVIEHITDKYLYDLPDEAVWVDGSGLSRYNLFTPRSIVRLWEKIYHEVPQDRLFDLLASGGKTGTLKNYYKAKNVYIYGKTGTFSNSHNLSGFLLTQSGKVLIFSFMNNHHITSSLEVKKRMEQLLYFIHQKY